VEYPYVALLWSPDHERPSIAASRLLLTIRRHCSGLHPLIIRQGLAVFTRPGPEESPIPTFLETYILSHQRGVIFGNLFRRGSGSRLNRSEAAADSGFADACLTACRRRLTDSYWGAYVALLSDPTSGDWSVLRDCSGSIPCYYTLVDGVTIVFSDVRDLRMRPASATNDAWLIPLEINWTYIAGFLAASQMQIRETGFIGVYELLAGESLQSTKGIRSVHIFWNPVSVAEADPLRDAGDACRELRETTCRCIEAWAGVHRHVAHSLSGGFDSTLVLSLLMRAENRPEVIAVNRFGFGPAEDERQYARLAAHTAGVELIELAHKTSPLESVCAEIPTTLKPNISQVFAGMDTAIRDALATADGIEDIWTGQGGDHLFMAIKTGMAVADCLRDNGLGPQLATVFRDAATLTGKSYFRLAREAHSLQRADRFFSVTEIKANTGFLATVGPFGEPDTYTRHPWALSSESLPPAKRMQILFLAEVLNRHRPNYGVQKLQEFHPLLSQPLIELCLRIPVYLLLATGKTRGLARRAFYGELPAAIRDRQQKGQTTHHVLGLVRDSRRYIAARLLDGRLADQRLIKRDELRGALEPHAPISGPALFALLACLAAEVWLEDWIRFKFARSPSVPTDELAVHTTSSAAHGHSPASSAAATSALRGIWTRNGRKA
jgi:asparagine synthase (glutamine-hydrolysing)